MLKKFRKILLVIEVISICFCFGSNVLGAEFSADLKIQQPDKEYEFKYYAQDNLYRLEKLTGDYRILVIADRHLDITWALNPEEKAYMELKGTDAIFSNYVRAWEAIRENQNKKQVGTETVLGYSCEKYTYTYPEQKEPSVEAWYSPKLNQFIRQIVHYSGSQGDGLLEMTNIVEAPQDDSLFEVPADYQREKSPAEKAEEKEAARPVLTKMEKTIAPAGRYIGPGGALKVKVDPEKSVQIVIKNQIKEKSTYKITPLREGLPVEDKIIHFSLTGQRKKDEPSFGGGLNEILIEVEEGLVIALVTKEYPWTDKIERKEYFVMEKSGQGLFTRENRKFVVTLTGDSQGSEGSPVTIKFYKGQSTDLLNEEDFNLHNGQIKKWEFNPGEIQTLMVSVGELGGVKLLSEQFPVEVKVEGLSKEERKELGRDIMHNKIEKVKALLDSGVDINTNITSKESMLMRACIFSNTEMIKLLLSYGPDISFQDKYGNNALTQIFQNYAHYREIVPLLLKAGADPNSKVGSSGEINFTALGKITTRALFSKNEEDYQLIEMFLSHGADPNQAPKTGTTPLMQAAYKGNIELVKLFLEYGADPSLKDNQGRTALDLAKRKNYGQVIDLLQ